MDDEWNALHKKKTASAKSRSNECAVESFFCVFFRLLFIRIRIKIKDSTEINNIRVLRVMIFFHRHFICVLFSYVFGVYNGLNHFCVIMRTRAVCVDRKLLRQSLFTSNRQNPISMNGPGQRHSKQNSLLNGGKIFRIWIDKLAKREPAIFLHSTMPMC